MTFRWFILKNNSIVAKALVFTPLPLSTTILPYLSYVQHRQQQEYSYQDSSVSTLLIASPCIDYDHQLASCRHWDNLLLISSSFSPQALCWELSLNQPCLSLTPEAVFSLKIFLLQYPPQI